LDSQIKKHKNSKAIKPSGFNLMNDFRISFLTYEWI
jgi:hypothetical protein